MNEKALTKLANQWGFRPKRDDETLDEYRDRLADHIEPEDYAVSRQVRESNDTRSQ